jgi:hypothetical protein
MILELFFPVTALIRDPTFTPYRDPDYQSGFKVGNRLPLRTTNG